MIQKIMKMAIRLWFAMTSREKAGTRIQDMRDKYLALSSKINGDCGGQPVTVPAMPGVDEDMRNWSFYMLMEHHAIVNRSITSIMQSLVQGQRPSGAGAIDPKKDVMPAVAAGDETIPIFKQSVADHLISVSQMDRLRGTLKSQHSLFGNFNAHDWHCMFGFHLMVHYKQAKLVIQKACSEPPASKYDTT